MYFDGMKEVNVLGKEFIENISTELKSQGIDVSDIIVELVIRQYLEEKRLLLTNQVEVVEGGIGKSYTGFRGLREGLSEKGYTAFLRYDLDQELKGELIDNYDKVD